MKNLKKVFIFVMISLILTLGIRQPCEVMASVKTITYDTGDSYIGNVDDSESSDPDEEEPDIFPSKQGKGTYYCADGTVITGTWDNNYLKGKATVNIKIKTNSQDIFQKIKETEAALTGLKTGTNSRVIGKMTK